MLTLWKPARKSLGELVGTGDGRPTYALVVAPLATEAVVLIRAKGADKVKPADLLIIKVLEVSGMIKLNVNP